MRSAQYAGSLSLAYMLSATLYIVLSGQIALAMSSSLEQLGRIEIYKGIGFVCFTALILFGFSWRLFERHLSGVREVERHRQAFIARERAATTGIFTASIAHDFNNILTVMLGSIQELETHKLPSPCAELIGDLNIASQRGAQICQRLSLASRALTHKLEPLDMVELINEAIGLIKLHHKSRRRQILFNSSSALMFYGDAALLHQLIINLLLNALDASRAQIIINLKHIEGSLVLEVDDDGVGVAPELKTKVFDAFFTTKSEGTGLGLVSVMFCAEAHHGQVQVLDSTRGGACFKVTLPIYDVPA